MEGNIGKVLCMIRVKCKSSPVQLKLQSIFYKKGNSHAEDPYRSAHCFEGTDYFFNHIPYRRHRNNYHLSYA